MAISGNIYHYLRGPKRATAKRQTPEADLQKAVVEYLTYALPTQYRFRAGMEGARRGYKEAGDAKAMGLRKGWPDIMLFNRTTRAVRWIELKAPAGRMTPEQSEIASELRDHLAVCRSVEDVEAALLAWGITPRCAIDAASRYGSGA